MKRKKGMKSVEEEKGELLLVVVVVVCVFTISSHAGKEFSLFFLFLCFDFMMKYSKIAFTFICVNIFKDLLHLDRVGGREGASDYISGILAQNYFSNNHLINV